jgi:hypothetical protein
MPDAPAFMPEGQSEYAFPAGQGDQDEASQSEQRNQSIQAAFDSQRFQRGFLQNVGKSLAEQGAQIARLRQSQSKT